VFPAALSRTSDAVERVEDAVPVDIRHARAVVDDADLHAGRAVVRICRWPRRRESVGTDLHRHRRHGGHSVQNDLFKAAPLSVQGKGAAVNVRQVNQSGYHTDEAIGVDLRGCGVAGHLFRRRGVAFGLLVAQGAGGQWAAQVARDGAQQPVA
jgi:hypothetical protein